MHYAPEDREKIRRPLSPVRLRALRPEDTPPKLLTIKERNEVRARSSPFVSHMPKTKKEHYLYTIGSVAEPDDQELLMEMALTSKLSKIASPIKPSQNARNLHLPRKVPTSDTYKNSYHESCHHPGLKQMPRMAIPDKNGDKVQLMILGDDNNNEEFTDAGVDSMWPTVSPYAQARAVATPGSCISDLSDRDTMTPLYSDRSLPTRASGGGGSGIYGDMEDDLVSAGSVNEDEYIL